VTSTSSTSGKVCRRSRKKKRALLADHSQRRRASGH
jgi:hypothetical protein